MKPMNEPIPSNNEPAGAAETLQAIGELIAAVFQMQPSSGTRTSLAQREPDPRSHRGISIGPEAERALKDALSEYNDRV
jgi:hypothetical protein